MELELALSDFKLDSSWADESPLPVELIEWRDVVVTRDDIVVIPFIWH